MSTMKDIAKLAGVSVATVSRIVNNDKTYRMRQETHDRVWKAIAQTGYKVPHPHVETARGAKRKAMRVGCILSVVTGKYRDPYFMSILSGIEERLTQYGYTLEFLRTQQELSTKRLLREILDNPPDALILMDTLSPVLYRTLCAKTPVCIGVDTQHEDIDNVCYDQYLTGRRAVETLIAGGHKDIAFVGGSPTDYLVDNERYQGYLHALLAAKLPVRGEWIHNCRWDEKVCMAQVREMMELPHPPTAVFAASDLMAMATLSTLYSMNISVPGQMAVIGITNIEMAQFSSPPLTTFAIPSDEIGLTVVDLIHQRFSKGFPLPRRVVLPTKLILRQSV